VGGRPAKPVARGTVKLASNFQTERKSGRGFGRGGDRITFRCGGKVLQGNPAPAALASAIDDSFRSTFAPGESAGSSAAISIWIAFRSQCSPERFSGSRWPRPEARPITRNAADEQARPEAALFARRTSLAREWKKRTQRRGNV